MYQISVEVVFDAAHRLLCETSKCRHNHGHTYHAWVRLGGETLNDEDMLLDFGTIKRFVRDWINEHWDHAYLCHRSDPLREVMQQHGLRYYTFEQNPTAEVMAHHLYEQVAGFLRQSNEGGVQLISVEIQETPTSRALYSADT